jgi:hypothetical protein
MPPSADAHGALVRPTCDTRPAKASDGTWAPISVTALKLAGRSAEQCRDAGCSVTDLIHLCYNPWKKGEKKVCSVEGLALRTGPLSATAVADPESVDRLTGRHLRGARSSPRASLA